MWSRTLNDSARESSSWPPDRSSSPGTSTRFAPSRRPDLLRKPSPPSPHNGPKRPPPRSPTSSPAMRKRLLVRHFLYQFVDNEFTPDSDRHQVLALVAAGVITVPLFVTVFMGWRY